MHAASDWLWFWWKMLSNWGMSNTCEKASKEQWWCPLPIHGWIWPWLSALNLRLVGLRQLPAGNGRRTKQRLRAPDFSAQLRLLFANRAKQKQKQNNSGGLHSWERFKHFNIFTSKRIVNLVLNAILYFLHLPPGTPGPSVLFNQF